MENPSDTWEFAIFDSPSKSIPLATSQQNRRRRRKKRLADSPKARVRKRSTLFIHQLIRMVVGVLSLVLVLTSLTGTLQFQFKHHDNDELLRVLQDVNYRCPNITRIYTLSETSVLGVPLYVIEFSPKPGHHEARKFFFIFFYSN